MLTDSSIQDRLTEVKNRLANKASYYDRERAFPFENFEAIRQTGLHVVNLPEVDGGQNFNVEQTCELLTQLSSGCGATALCLAMHLYSVGGFQHILHPKLLAEVNKKVREGHYIASISNPNVYFLYKNEDFERVSSLKATKVAGGYIVNGTKPYVSGAPIVYYIPLYCYTLASQGQRAGITAMLANRDMEGITVKDTWNISGMVATMTHQLDFDNVFIPDSNLIGSPGRGLEATHELIYWFRLALCAVYQGIARSAYDYVLDMVKKKVDVISQKKMCFLPNVQYAIADMKVLLDNSQTILLAAARQVDRDIATGTLGDVSYLTTLEVKQTLSNSVNEIIAIAAKIQGTCSLQRGNLLERLYRDANALHYHPPREDLLKEYIAKKELGIIPLKNRWI
ncbi:acyl-CoA dehydrogenase family protein [Paenibacillus tyrfis]|uniref:acyl-CoA dehydrogenase family protein n=1 Tax=Paenibacillus tyrfis TaxID=1501230 RepID=UPI00209DC6C1|nr:acyl-CoA dehydrogenase family protein [Paenibacillus tyrfis]MCP1311577.1 acyl-CoA/acyl-ACP dehydrogenase [Paenibacillus tyrfis]